MNPVAVGLLVVAVGVAPFALTNPGFNMLDVIGVLCAGGCVLVQTIHPRRAK